MCTASIEWFGLQAPAPYVAALVTSCLAIISVMALIASGLSQQNHHENFVVFPK